MYVNNDKKMNIDFLTETERIRKIEDIIDIQKANGNFNLRQVAFNVPSETESTLSANLARSVESGLPTTKLNNIGKSRFKKIHSNRQKSPLSDRISWPSDSDITVLKMKLCVSNRDLTEPVGIVIPGDGRHQCDSSSLVNLATLMRQSESMSKHSFNIEEYLLPLTSWEQEYAKPESNKEPRLKVEQTPTISITPSFKHNFNVYRAECSRENEDWTPDYSNLDYSRIGRVPKLAKFLRLYFCPCCTCLYKLENMHENNSSTCNNRCSDKEKQI